MQAKPARRWRGKACPLCGGPYFAEEIEGLCPHCLRRMLLRFDAQERRLLLDCASKNLPLLAPPRRTGNSPIAPGMA